MRRPHVYERSAPRRKRSDALTPRHPVIMAALAASEWDDERRREAVRMAFVFRLPAAARSPLGYRL